MLTYSGQRVKLIDFSHSDSESFVILKTAVSTNKYIAPELLDGVAQPSVKSDIYSFGVIVKALARISDDSELMRVAKDAVTLIPACVQILSPVYCVSHLDGESSIQ